MEHDLPDFNWVTSLGSILIFTGCTYNNNTPRIIAPSKKERFGCVFCRGWLDLQTTSDLRSHDSEGGMNDYIAQMSSKRSLYVSSNSCGISGLQIKPAAQPDPAWLLMSGSQVTYNHNSRMARKMSSLLQRTWTKKKGFPSKSLKETSVFSKVRIFPRDVYRLLGSTSNSSSINANHFAVPNRSRQKITRWTYWHSFLLGAGI